MSNVRITISTLDLAVTKTISTTIQTLESEDGKDVITLESNPEVKISIGSGWAAQLGLIAGTPVTVEPLTAPDGAYLLSVVSKAPKKKKVETTAPERGSSPEQMRHVKSEDDFPVSSGQIGWNLR